jgi:hypothetical protein
VDREGTEPGQHFVAMKIDDAMELFRVLPIDFAAWFVPGNGFRYRDFRECRRAPVPVVKALSVA